VCGGGSGRRGLRGPTRDESTKVRTGAEKSVYIPFTSLSSQPVASLRCARSAAIYTHKTSSFQREKKVSSSSGESLCINIFAAENIYKNQVSAAFRALLYPHNQLARVGI